MQTRKEKKETKKKKNDIKKAQPKLVPFFLYPPSFLHSAIHPTSFYNGNMDYMQNSFLHAITYVGRIPFRLFLVFIQ